MERSRGGDKVYTRDEPQLVEACTRVFAVLINRDGGHGGEGRRAEEAQNSLHSPSALFRPMRQSMLGNAASAVNCSESTDGWAYPGQIMDKSSTRVST